MSQDDLYQKNFEALRRLRPALAEKLEQDDAFDIPAEAAAGKRGLPTMKITPPDGKPLTVHSVFDPASEAEEALARARAVKDPEAIEQYLIIGFGLGYHVEAALTRNRNKSRVVVLEPSLSVFKTAMRARDLGPIISSNRTVIGLGDGKIGLIESLQRGLEMSGRWDVAMIELNYACRFEAYYQLIRDAIGDWTQQVSLNQFTILQLGEEFLFNMTANFLYSYFNPGLPEIMGRFRGKPAVVVAPGPSLVKNIDLLAEIYDKALIISLDTALKPLLRRGIKPHFVMSVDPKEANYAKYRGLDIPDDVTLFAALDTYPKIFSNFSGRVFSYFHNALAMNLTRDFLGDKGVLGSGGSVACDAFFLAVAVGADPVVFAGLDLSFPDKKWYMDGSFREDGDVGKVNRATEGECREFIWVEDIYGDKVATYPQYYTAYNWFNIQVPKVKALVIDATEGGARIDGTEIRTMREVIDEYCREPINPYEDICRIHEAYEPYEREKALDKIDELIKQAGRFVDLSARGMEFCDQFDHFVAERKVGRVKKTAKRIGRVNKQILAMSEMLSIMELALSKSLYRIEAFDEEEYDEADESRRHKDVVELSRWFFRDVKRVCSVMKNRFEYIRAAVDAGEIPADQAEESMDWMVQDMTSYIEPPRKVIEDQGDWINGIGRKDKG